MSIAAPPKSSCSRTHFRYEKGFFYKIQCGVLEQRTCIYSGAPNDCFLRNICQKRQKLPRLFYSLRKAENFQMTVPFMYNFKTLSNKIPRTPPRRFFGDFIYFVRSCFVYSFLFSRLNSQRAKKNVFVERNNFTLVSTVLFFLLFNFNLVQLCQHYSLVMTALEETEYVHITPCVFTKRRWEE